MNKKILKVLCLMLGVVLLFTMVSCTKKPNNDDPNKPTPPGHTHKYSTEYTYDEDYHWYKATCGCKDQISGKEKHNFVNKICSDCGYEFQKEITFDGSLFE